MRKSGRVKTACATLEARRAHVAWITWIILSILSVFDDYSDYDDLPVPPVGLKMHESSKALQKDFEHLTLDWMTYI